MQTEVLIYNKEKQTDCFDLSKNNGNSWPVFVQKPDVFVQKTKTFVQKQIETCGYSLCFLLVCQRISGIDSEETAETDDVMPFYL